MHQRVGRRTEVMLDAIGDGVPVDVQPEQDRRASPVALERAYGLLRLDPGGDRTRSGDEEHPTVGDGQRHRASEVAPSDLWAGTCRPDERFDRLAGFESLLDEVARGRRRRT